MEPHYNGAPERLDIPFALKSIHTVRQDDGSEVGVFEGLIAQLCMKCHIPRRSVY